MRKFLVVLVCLVGCTPNQNAKQFGGTATTNLEKGRKLVNVTWKENSLWILTRDMREDESAETYKFSEKSSFGIMEGTYIIKEEK